ncbi:MULTISPECIES: hypothetical protein [unclassified Neptuniibacter]|uniref:hypothetical protein n=1 Tax=unclassified Neptuniibacter TaxID=2630693 RepID=UPI000C3C6A9E|nr:MULTISPECIES: hypothetical protein [unclassified Neptuniibacter]MAY41898.1 hypothetical protein [Oceanospirillaceae bacterium]
MELESTLLIGIGGAGTNILKQMNCLDIDQKIYIDLNPCPREKDDHTSDFSISENDLKAIRLESQLPASTKKKLNHLVFKYDCITVFIGLGGRTGSTIAQTVIEECCKGDNETTVIASLPFLYEGERREIASEALSELEQLNCKLIVHDLEEARQEYPKDSAFDAMLSDINIRMSLDRLEENRDAANIEFDDLNIDSLESLLEVHPNACSLSVVGKILGIESSNIDEASLSSIDRYGFYIDARIACIHSFELEPMEAQLHFIFSSYLAYIECSRHLEKACTCKHDVIAISDIYSVIDSKLTLFGPKLTFLQASRLSSF